MFQSEVKTKGNLDFKVWRCNESEPVPASLAWKIKNFLRWDHIRTNAGIKVAKTFAKATGVMVGYSSLEAEVGKAATGERIDYGIISRRLVTENFVDYITDMLQAEETMVGDFKYHGRGVGVGAAAAADTNLGTADGDARDAGTQTEQAGTTGNDYQSVATYTSTGTIAVTEHGLFNIDTSAGDTQIMMDRHVFSALNVVINDTITWTYTLTLASGG